MDTSKEYILMCEKAPKLQPHDLEFENRDYISYKGKWGIYFNASFYLEGTFDEGFIDYELNPFRIHTQDQLQGMLHKTFQGVYALGKCAYLFNGIKKNREYYGIFKSMEQLWLAFVMKEKYNKIWNGEEWKKL